MRVLLDTHIWIWWLTSDAQLSIEEHEALAKVAAKGDLRIAAISLWEVQMLVAKGRFKLSLPFDQWIMQATDERVLSIEPLDQAVSIALNDLPASFHGDPADRLIVATARAYNLPLATHDKTIRRSRAVKLWKP